MQRMKRFLCLLLCLCTIVPVAVMPIGAADDYVNTIAVSVTTPTAGFKPAKASVSSTASTEVLDTKWEGKLDANGCFIGGEKYTVTVTLGIKDGVERFFKKGAPGNYTIANKVARMVEHTINKVVLSYPFTASEAKAAVGARLTVDEPVAGQKPADAKLNMTGVKVEKTEWIGELSNGTFKDGVSYTGRFTLVSTMDSVKLKITDPTKATVNGLESTIVSSTTDKVVLEFRFAPAHKKTAAVAENGEVKVASFYYAQPVAGEKPPVHIAVAQSDALTVSNVEWSGKFDENGRFIPGNTYNLKFVVNVRDGVDLSIPSAPSYTLNGKNLREGAGVDGNIKKHRYFHISNMKIEFPRNVVDISKLYTMEEADKLESTQHAHDLIVTTAWVDEQIKKYGEHEFNFLRSSEWSPVDEALDVNEEAGNPEVIYATRFLIDEPRDNDQRASGGSWFSVFPLVKEIWFSPSMDAEKFIRSFSFSNNFSHAGRGIHTWDCTVYIPASKYPKGLLSELSYTLNCRVQLYDGDVYQAFERAGKGEKVGREWCPGHKFVNRFMWADRVAAYPTCTTPMRYYYTCEHCGQPEYNDKHTFMANFDAPVSDPLAGRIGHKYSEVIDPKHLIGKNAQGDLVYAQTCDYCGLDYAQVQRGEDLTEAIYKRDYNLDGLSFKQYVQRQQEGWEKYTKGNALKGTVDSPAVGFFVVSGSKAVSAKLSGWSVNSVQWAAQNDLLDKDLLGGDYTKTISRLQFCSIVVKLAEKITGFEITPAPANTFSDSDNVYVRKAYAAGITSGTGNGTFSPNATLTREQMATFMNNVFKYVVNNSGIRYSAYDSKLASYTDSNKISDWAKEPLAKMNAYGLINGTGATTLSPTNNCTIEQAIVVARGGIRAHEVGWYQADGWDSYYFWPDTSAAMYTEIGYYNGDRIWVCAAPTGGWDDDAWLPVDSPITDRTGLRMYAKSEHFKPIRELLPGDVELYNKYVPAK